MYEIDKPQRDIGGSEIPVAYQIFKVRYVPDEEPRAVPSGLYSIMAVESVTRKIGHARMIEHALRNWLYQIKN